MWSALAALLHARATGQGQSIDIAMYEVAHKVLGGTMVDYFRNGHIRSREDNRAAAGPWSGTYQCADGWIVIGEIEDSGRIDSVIGPRPSEGASRDDATAATRAALEAWLAERSCQDALKALNGAAIACSKVMSAKDMAEDPYYKARSVHVDWEDAELGKVRGVGIVPKFSATPGKIWRGAATVGRDNALVYRELLGLSDEQMKALTADGIM
jgi:crotonobetainyl-CoA:carnitine CoA-transferase CaiB-like acyl-CoA transferase